MKHTPSSQVEISRLDKRKRVILVTLLAFSAIWFPLSLFLNPGWGTLGLLANPIMLLASLIPAGVVVFVNAMQPQDRSLPQMLFRLEIAFGALWILLWCFMVNGDDATIHSIFSRLFSAFWNEETLVTLSSRLFGCTMLALAFLALFMAIYRQSSQEAKRMTWGRWLLVTNFVYLLISFAVEPVLASFGVYINPYWTWFYVLLDMAVLVLGILNVIYLLRYFITHKNIRLRGWIAGILAILISLYAVWGASNMLVFFLSMNRA